LHGIVGGTEREPCMSVLPIDISRGVVKRQRILARHDVLLESGIAPTDEDLEKRPSRVLQCPVIGRSNQN
jgi:hypothetical protein